MNSLLLPYCFENTAGKHFCLNYQKTYRTTEHTLETWSTFLPKFTPKKGPKCLERCWLILIGSSQGLTNSSPNSQGQAPLQV